MHKSNYKTMYKITVKKWDKVHGRFTMWSNKQRQKFFYSVDNPTYLLQRLRKRYKPNAVFSYTFELKTVHSLQEPIVKQLLLEL